MSISIGLGLVWDNFQAASIGIMRPTVPNGSILAPLLPLKAPRPQQRSYPAFLWVFAAASASGRTSAAFFSHVRAFLRVLSPHCELLFPVILICAFAFAALLRSV
jgi:hypothetical protein